MTAIDIAVATDFADRGVAVRLGIVTAAVAVAPAGPALAAALDEVVAGLPARLAGAPVSQVPAVAATRHAYRALGKDPARYRPAAEALMRRVAQGKGLYRVNNVVDVNNLLSLETGFSIGTYDLDRLAPPLRFRRAGAGETYAGIGRGPLNLEGLPVFADDRGPFGSPTSDSERTMVTAAARRVLMVVVGFGGAGGLAPALAADLDRAVAVAEALLAAHCAGPAGA
ncbi:MAG: hypothetical protein H6906_03110 [Hyphomicrobiales bacterium]|nr:hypothetical protein [Hyphomicrobiales bacterium]